MIRRKLLVFLISIVFVGNPATIQAFRVFNVNGVQTILALENEDISIVCKTGMPMAYCGFIHPTGKRYSFSGQGLIDGRCVVKIKATANDDGPWRCHIGKQTIGVEIMQNIQVRVVQQIAAIQPNITAVHGKDVTLACASTRGLVPLSYCRFEPPNGIPFSIDSAIKPTSAILDKYYYPQNMSLDRGDCAVTIRKVKYTDVGAWTCGAGFDDGKEHTDVIRLEVEGLYTMSTASTTGITFGAIGVAVFLAILGFIAWKKRRVLGTSEREPEAIEVEEFAPRPHTPGSQRSPHMGRDIALRPHTPGSQRSPYMERDIPLVTVESPSDPGSSPGFR